MLLNPLPHPPGVTATGSGRCGLFLVDVLVMRELTMVDEALVFTTLGDLEGVRACGP